LDDLGNNYRIRFRLIEVVSAAIQALPSYNLRKDNQTKALLQDSSGTVTNSGGSAGGFSSTGYSNGLNYSTGYKVGMGFANWVYGLGSFIMGDWVEGLIIGGSDLLGMVIMVSSSGDNGPGIGALLILGATIYGHIRPFSYDKALAKKNGAYYASENPMDHIKVAVIPDAAGIKQLNLTYSWQF
jgi:hypothetical protein